ncbi:MAG: DUF2946 family protein [Stellaceae bacterium]
MVAARQRRRPRTARSGAALAFLALALQVLLPFLVAFDIALASRPAEAGPAGVICSAGLADAHASPSSNRRATHHHGLSDNCPICTALAASQAFTAASPILLPLPRDAFVFAPERVAVRGIPGFAAAAYDSRAPPSAV